MSQLTKKYHVEPVAGQDRDVSQYRACEVSGVSFRDAVSEWASIMTDDEIDEAYDIEGIRVKVTCEGRSRVFEIGYECNVTFHGDEIETDDDAVTG